ncbi:putative cytochrome P450 monooxygenase [Patellaria atrata CBS 101060]|uniref:Cytochrome P450 monooxygenase n=1 Tax=Patellaria atrata CBS 101060 TaxID=1346257 RepID=A0A9P4S313_9PEZI|nr:putative cytochrome P450 monooxygenase [Patellaria atrata CBS 101060]
MGIISNDWLDRLADAYTKVRDIGHPRLLVYIFLLILLWRIIKAYFFSPLRHIRGPFFARITSLRAIFNRTPARVFAAALADYRTYGDIYVSKPNTVCISHPQDVRAVLGSHEFQKIDVYHGLNDPVMANIVTFNDVSLASRRRRQINPYFNLNYIAKMEPLILRNGILAIKEKWDKLIKQNSDKPIVINYRHDTQLATFDIMSALAFGREIGKESGSLATNDLTVVDWIAATAVYVGVRIHFNLLLVFPFSMLIRRWIRLYDEFVRYSRDSVAKRKDLLVGTDLVEKPADMLQAFIDAEDPESKIKMSSVEVQAESVGMQLAGSETTSASLTWSLHLLTLYPEYLKRAQDEVRSQFSLEHLVTFAECRRSLPFLESFLYEMLRYSPITSGFMPRFSSTKSITLQGHYLPPQTDIAFNLIAMNYRADTWEKPEKFLPDRFLNNEASKRNLFAFSYGARSCIGRNLAWAEMMTILANLLKDYEFSLPKDAIYSPTNVDEYGNPLVMPSKCHIVFAPTHPDRDCRLIISKRYPIDLTP